MKFSFHNIFEIKNLSIMDFLFRNDNLVQRFDCFHQIFSLFLSSHTHTHTLNSLPCYCLSMLTNNIEYDDPVCIDAWIPLRHFFIGIFFDDFSIILILLTTGFEIIHFLTFSLFQFNSYLIHTLIHTQLKRKNMW